MCVCVCVFETFINVLNIHLDILKYSKSCV